MTSLLDIIQLVCREAHVPMVHSVFGESGVNATFKIMETVKNLYKDLEPSRVRGRIVVYQMVASTDCSTTPVPSGPTTDFGSLSNRSITDLAFENVSEWPVFKR